MSCFQRKFKFMVCLHFIRLNYEDSFHEEYIKNSQVFLSVFRTTSRRVFSPKSSAATLNLLSHTRSTSKIHQTDATLFILVLLSLPTLQRTRASSGLLSKTTTRLVLTASSRSGAVLSKRMLLLNKTKRN